MSSSGIRVQVPGGTAYHPALVEAAAKTAMRNDFDDEEIARLSELMTLAASAVNSVGPTRVVLEIELQGRAMHTTLDGTGGTGHIRPSDGETFERAATKHASSHDVSPDKAVVTFVFTG